MFIALVVPEFRAHHFGVFKLFGRVYHINEPKAFALKPSDTASYFAAVLVYDPFGQVSVGTGFVAFKHDIFWHIQHYRRRVYILRTCKFDDFFSVILPDVGGIYHSQLHVGKSLFCRVVEQVKSIARSVLVVFVIADHSSEKVRGQHFCGLEVFQRKTALPRRCSAHHSHKASIGYLYLIFIHLFISFR